MCAEQVLSRSLNKDALTFVISDIFGLDNGRAQTNHDRDSSPEQVLARVDDSTVWLRYWNLYSK